MPSLHAVSFDRHGKKTLLPLSSWKFAAGQHLAPLMAKEFPQVAQFFPIIFISQPEKGTSAVILLGFEQGQNLFLNEKAEWFASYIPAFFRRYPFFLVKAKDLPEAPATPAGEEQYVLCLDEASGLLADNGGTPLFDEEGNQSKLLKNILEFASDYERQTAIVKSFCTLVEEMDLLKPLAIRLSDGKGTISVQGMMQIDEQKFTSLSDESFIKLRHQGVLPMIYAHLLSLNRIAFLKQRFQQLKAAKTEKNEKKGRKISELFRR